MSRSDYITRVKKGIELYEAMEALKDKEELTIEFGDRGEFKIRCHEYPGIISNKVRRSYSISDGELFGKQMNIDMSKSGKSYLVCYTYDLFSNKTEAKLYFEHITIK